MKMARSHQWSETLSEQLKDYSRQDQNFAKKVELAVEEAICQSTRERFLRS